MLAELVKIRAVRGGNGNPSGFQIPWIQGESHMTLTQKAAFAFNTTIKLNPENTKARKLLDNCMSQF